MFPCFQIPGRLWFPHEIQEVCDYLFTHPHRPEQLVVWRVRKLAPQGYEHLAEDVFHNLYVQLREEGFPKFDPRKGEFLTQFFCNTRIFYLYKNGWKKEVKFRWETDIYEMESEIPSDVEPADGELFSADTLKKLSDCVKELSPDHKEVIILRYTGMSYVQIAKQLGIPIGTVGKRISDSHKRLLKLLKNKGMHKGNFFR